MPSTWPVSSSESPPKNRNSAIGSSGIELRETRQRLVEREHVDVGRPASAIRSSSVTFSHRPERLAIRPRPRMVHGDAPHDLGRHAEELRAVLPAPRDPA